MSELKLRKILWLVNKIAPYVTMEDVKAYIEELELSNELSAKDVKDIIIDIVTEV